MIWRSTASALALLSKRYQRLFFLLIIIQASFALFDLLGIFVLGTVVALTASLVSGQETPALERIINILGLDQWRMESVILVLAVAGGLILVGKSLLSFLVMRRTLGFLANRQAMVAGELAAALLSAPLVFVQKRSSQSNAYALIGGVNATMIGVLGHFATLVSELFLVLILLIGLFVVSPPITLATLVYFALVGYILHRLLSLWAGKLGAAQQETEIASLTSIQETLRSYREISVSGRRLLRVGTFRALRWRAAGILADVQISQQVSKYVFEIALVIGAGLLAWSQFVTASTVTAATTVGVFLIASTRLMPSLLRLQSSIFGLRTSAGASQPTFDLARELKEMTLHQDDVHEGQDALTDRICSEIATDHLGFNAHVSVQDVSFGYGTTTSFALCDINLEIPHGTSIALVGPTGAGKSTLADVILGLLPPSKGSVSIGGIPPTQAIFQHPGALAYVPQDVTVIEGTIRDNVTIGLPREVVDDDLVWKALERANLAEYLRSQREGIDTRVGEHGIRLSGGQRQRLGMARALYTRPKLIVLDEATSALDAETERAVSESLTRLRGTVTTIVIAHRLATVRHCDQVVYLENGELVAVGTFGQVRDQSPGFDRQARLMGL